MTLHHCKLDPVKILPLLNSSFYNPINSESLPLFIFSATGSGKKKKKKPTAHLSGSPEQGHSLPHVTSEDAHSRGEMVV